MKRIHSRESSQELDDSPLSVQTELDNCEDELSKKPKNEELISIIDQHSIQSKEITVSCDADAVQCTIDDKDVCESQCKDGKYLLIITLVYALTK